MHQPRDDSRPPGLMARPETRAVVAVEVLVEQEQIAPVRIGLKLRRSSVDGAMSVAVAQEDGGEAARDFLRDLIERHLPARSRGTFDGEVVSVIRVVLEQRPD